MPSFAASRFVPLACIALVPFVSRAASDLDLAIGHLREFYDVSRPGFAMRDTNEAYPETDEALKDLKSLGADGSWPDIEYHSKARSAWPAAKHPNRMAAMAAVAFRSQGAQRDALISGLHRAFAHWIKADPKCVNWWYNQIGGPKTLTTTALLMGDSLSPAERDWFLKTIAPRTKIGMTGQNRIWLAGNTLMLGLLARDEATVDKAAKVIHDEVVITTEEGLQPDFSFHQHGAQQQFGNYGLAFASEITRWAGVLRDTRWALSGEKLDIFRNYMLKGQNWISWRGAMDIGACGRQLMPGSPPAKTRTIASAMSESALLDPAHAKEYTAFVDRNKRGAVNDLVGTTYFWRSDYLVHRTPELCFALKMSSVRVIGAETTNHENISGYHIADGMQLTYKAGDEYEEIFPVWNWSGLPGITAAEVPVPAFGTTSVKVDFVGGVTDGDVGVAALNYDKAGVAARKAWFFTPSGVIALGAGVSGTAAADIVTTLNQSRLRGPVTVSKAGTTGAAANGILPGINWLEHDGLRYTPLSGTTLTLKTGPSTGNWKRIYDNPSTPTADVTMNLFTLSADHGAKPKDAAYAYAIGLAGSAPDAAGLIDTTSVQVAKLDANRTGYVFWKDGASGEVSTDTPCVLITDKAAKAFFVAEPTHKLKSLKITYAGKTYAVTLPVKGFAGSTVKVPE